LSYTIEEAIDRVSRGPRPLGAKRIADEIRRVLAEGAIDVVYRDRVLAGRTRQYSLPTASVSARVEIIHTLLGIELKIANRRLLCPDYATARYLSVFARLGGGTIAVPYDITGISTIADELESSLQRMMLLADLLTRERSPRMQSLVKRRLAAAVSDEIARLGSGAKFPEFTPPRRRRQRPASR
jgi:hypothetical protein